MVHAGANVADNGCDFGGAIGPPAIINEDADRLVELADAFDPLVELQFGMDAVLKKPSLISLLLKLVRSAERRALMSIFSAGTALLISAPIAMAAKGKR